MATGIKRIDRTKVLIKDLEKAASAAVKESAIMLKVIAREMVSRKYVKTTQQAKRDSGKRHWNAEQIAAEKARGRAGFTNRTQLANSNAATLRSRSVTQQAGTRRFANAGR